MCRMTDTGFRWQSTIPVPLIRAKYYVYEREPGVHRYSRQNELGFKPLYAVRVTACTTPLRDRMRARQNGVVRPAWDGETF